VYESDKEFGTLPVITPEHVDLNLPSVKAPGSDHSSIAWGSRDRQVWTCAHMPRGN